MILSKFNLKGNTIFSATKPPDITFARYKNFYHNFSFMKICPETNARTASCLFSVMAALFFQDNNSQPPLACWCTVKFIRIKVKKGKEVRATSGQGD